MLIMITITFTKPHTWSDLLFRFQFPYHHVLFTDNLYQNRYLIIFPSLFTLNKRISNFLNIFNDFNINYKYNVDVKNIVVRNALGLIYKTKGRENLLTMPSLYHQLYACLCIHVYSRVYQHMCMWGVGIYDLYSCTKHIHFRVQVCLMYDYETFAPHLERLKE